MRLIRLQQYVCEFFWVGRVCAFLGVVWCVCLQRFLDRVYGVEDRWCLFTRLLVLLNFSVGAVVVGFGWWLCGVLGLFTEVNNIFYCVDILF